MVISRTRRSQQDSVQAQRADSGFEFSGPKVLVLGVGGAGCNSVNRIQGMGLQTAQLVACNTDKQHLATIDDELTKLLIGKSITQGMGAGGHVDVGERCAEASRKALEEVLGATDLLFLVAGMGGGTGTGACPVIARIAKEQGSIVIGIVTYPFALERSRVVKAELGIAELTRVSDSVVIIDNNRFVELVPNLPMNEAFKVVDEVIARCVRGITESMTQPGLINLDFADVKAVLENKGIGMLAVGESADQANRVEAVVNDTLDNALLDVDISGATGCLIHITGGSGLTLGEANSIGELLTKEIDPGANVIWGARVDPNFGNKIEVIAIFAGVQSSLVSKVTGPQYDPSNVVKPGEWGVKRLKALKGADGIIEL